MQLPFNLADTSRAGMPIPGTGSTAHLEENVVAASLHLDEDEVRAIADAMRST